MPKSKSEIDRMADALLVQKDQMDKIKKIPSEIDIGLESLANTHRTNQASLDELNSSVDVLLAERGLSLKEIDISHMTEEEQSLIALTEEEKAEIQRNIPKISDSIDTLNYGDNWEDYLQSVYQYGKHHELDFSKDPFDELLTPRQRADILKRVDEVFKIKKCQCDKYDYMIAATCGAIGGLIDAFFVGKPGESKLGKWTDKQVDKSIQKFATACGWKGPRGNTDPAKSATGFLERKFPVNYDHKNTAAVDRKFKMNTKNHHIKSLAHSPSPIGLFFSILGQFTDVAYFVDGGQLIKIDTGTMELQGGNLIAQLFCGFVNWIGHIISDIAGSSGSTGRGSGIPIPFFELFQFIDTGEIGKYKKTIAELSVEVFQKGYDFRHGLAMAIPVAIAELSIRLIYGFKSYFYHKKSTNESIKNALSGSEIRRMLLVGHGTLCLVDVTDAAIRSGGEPVNMLLHMNFIGWVRFAHLGFQEILIISKVQKYDIDAMNATLDKELLEIIG